MEEERSNFIIYIYLILYVNKKFEWQGSLKDKILEEFNIINFK